MSPMNAEPLPARRRIFVVDDHPVVRDGLDLLLRSTNDLQLCGDANDRTTALDGIARTSPDLVIVDLRLGDDSGLPLIRESRDRFPDVPILVLSMHREDDYAGRVLRAGASGYVMKGEPTSVLLAGIREVLGGRVFLSGRMTAKAVKRMSAGDPAPSPIARLTDRELQVFELLGRGLASRAIAAELGVGTKTIETHCHNIKSKLGLRNANELIHQATVWSEHARDD